MNYIKVILWDCEIGRLAWNQQTRRTYFTFNPKEIGRIPNIAPLLAPISNAPTLLPIYGDERPIYHGLPPFIADSLPDSWGSTLFDKWVNDNKIPRSKITPLYKLTFIGKRGMGALEFEPAAENLEHLQRIDVKTLYELAMQVLEQRDRAIIKQGDPLTMQSLLAVGTSAGGRQMKAIIAIEDETGEIRSGQTADLEGYTHYILKFGDSHMPIAEIEMAYHSMVKECGIDMEDSYLKNIDGINHFLTKRFDRRHGKKIFTQTLAAIYPDANSYEDLIDVAKKLSLSKAEIEEIFRRLVFNVLSNNTDDHNKNFSFLMDENGRWRLAPAYDMTFIFNNYGTGPNLHHKFSVKGNVSDISKADILELAKNAEIRRPEEIIRNIAKAISNFDAHAEKYGVKRPWRDMIWKTLRENIEAYGYASPAKHNAAETASGQRAEDLIITLNSKGHYDIIVLLEGARRRRIIKPGTTEYEFMCHFDIYGLDAAQKSEIISHLFFKS